MRIAAFAAGPVGRDIAAVLAELSPACLLVIDDADPGGHNDAIVATHPAGTPVRTGSSIAADPRTLAAHGTELGLLAWWPRIVQENVLSIAPRGFLNCHPSLLPYGRGKDPNFWAIIERTPFGVTLHHVVSAIDAGPIAFQREIPVGLEDSGATLYEKSAEAMVELIREALPRIIRGDIPAVAQEPLGLLHLRADLEVASELILDAPTTAREVLDILRARTFVPHPPAWFDDRGVRYNARVEIVRRHGSNSGE